MGQLMSVIEEIWKVSEKDFNRIDKVVEIADRICRSQKANEIIEASKVSNERPRLCAERIYCFLKEDIRENESPN